MSPKGSPSHSLISPLFESSNATIHSPFTSAKSNRNAIVNPTRMLMITTMKPRTSRKFCVSTETSHPVLSNPRKSDIKRAVKAKVDITPSGTFPGP
mmetsp:Transcript_1671/g.1842  ORF Transcript_1671/g.1842 Transcript_1671/m.1842 type:complete len:96 (-) Transcript_1671:1145-1432(-)